ncbi:MAG: diguanylate cyclase (GGDEF)-like protein [Sulfurimonas sp.]|jgi:diguanylate cyclase (GGDEF)-like protein
MNKQHKFPLEFVKKVRDTISNRDSLEGELKQTTIDGKESWFQNTIMPILNDYGVEIGEGIVRYDITQKKVFEQLSITDPMTKLYNRRHFNDILTREIGRASREKNSLSFIILDVDFFKKYNDANGHKAGDEALIAVANTLKGLLNRGSDFAFRLGGEEFGIIFSRSDESKSLELAEKIRKAIENLEIIHSASTVSKFLTISLGLLVVDFCENFIDENGFYTIADDALYSAKEKGRNRIHVHQNEELELF